MSGGAPEGGKSKTGGDANANLRWPSLALQKRPPPSFFLAQAKGVRLSPRSQAPSHLQVTKQVHLGYRKPGQELATQPNIPYLSNTDESAIVFILKKMQLNKAYIYMCGVLTLVIDNVSMSSQASSQLWLLTRTL